MDGPKASALLDVGDWLRSTVTRLVDHSSQVTIDRQFMEDDGETWLKFDVKVADDDVKLMIGRDGATIKMIRALAQAMAWKWRCKSRVDIVDPHPEKRGARDERGTASSLDPR